MVFILLGVVVFGVIVNLIDVLIFECYDWCMVWCIILVMLVFVGFIVFVFVCNKLEDVG